MTNSSLSSALKSVVLVSLLAGIAGCGKDDGSASFKAGEEALSENQTDKAIRQLTASLEVAPDNVDALVLLTGAYLQFGRIPEARQAIARAQALAGGEVDVIELAAKASYFAESYDEAEKLYRSLTDEKFEPIVRSRGLTGIGIIDMARIPAGGAMAPVYRDRARTEFLRAIRLDGRNASARYHLAMLYRDWGYNEIAYDNFDIFVRLDKLENKSETGSKRATRVVSSIMPDLKDQSAQALQHVKGADRRDSAACADALKKAQDAWSKGTFKTAKLRYADAYAADVLSYEAAIGLARAWEKVDPSNVGLSEALKYYHAACKLRPSYKDTILKTANLAAKLGKHAMAAEAYSRAVAASPNDITAIDGLIRALKSAGQTKSADIYQKYRDTIPVRKR